MGFARKVANRVIFMDEGKIVEDSPKDAFFDDPEIGPRKRLPRENPALITWRAYPSARHLTLYRFAPRICYILGVTLCRKEAHNKEQQWHCQFC